MLYVGHAIERTCRGITRRELLQVGGIGMLGLTLADGWRSRPLPPQCGQFSGTLLV